MSGHLRHPASTNSRPSRRACSARHRHLRSDPRRRAPGGAARDAAGAGHGDQDPARARRLCAGLKSTGLPVEIVERNFDEVQRREQIRNMQDILGSSPVLARQMMDPEFAKLAHQDLEPLSGIEGVATFFKNSGKAMVGGLYDASAGVVGVGQSAAELLQFATKPLAGRVLPVDVGGMIARDLSAYRQGIEAEVKRWTRRPTACCRAGGIRGLSSLSRNLASLPLLFFPGGQGAALAGMTLLRRGRRVRQGRATLSWASARAHLRRPQRPH